jgi:hypothetical protein
LSGIRERVSVHSNAHGGAISCSGPPVAGMGIDDDMV